jgi:hypothetical protein
MHDHLLHQSLLLVLVLLLLLVSMGPSGTA